MQSELSKPYCFNIHDFYSAFLPIVHFWVNTILAILCYNPRQLLQLSLWEYPFLLCLLMLVISWKFALCCLNKLSVSKAVRPSDAFKINERKLNFSPICQTIVSTKTTTCSFKKCSSCNKKKTHRKFSWKTKENALQLLWIGLPQWVYVASWSAAACSTLRKPRHRGC